MTTYNNIKSVIIDIANKWQPASYMGPRSIDFYLSSAKHTIDSGNCTCYATSTLSGTFAAAFSFYTAKLKTGAWENNQWLSSSAPTNQRLIIVFDTVKSIDEIVINNGHSSGAAPEIGVKDTEIWFSTDTITDTTFQASISNSTYVHAGVIRKHISSNVVDDITIIPETLTPPIDEYRIVFARTEAGYTGALTLAALGLRETASGSNLAMSGIGAFVSTTTDYQTIVELFDSDAATWWGCNISAALLTAGSISFYFKLFDFAEYTLQARAAPYQTQSPQEWVVEKYNGSSWDEIESRTGETGWSDNETRTYTLPEETETLTADPGEYIITGSDADLISGMDTMSADPGEYVLTGSDVSLIIHKIEVDPGEYVLTGSDVDLEISRFIEPDSGTYTITGSASDLIVQKFIPVDPGAYVITGSDVDFKIGLGPTPPGVPVYLFTLTGAPDSTTDIEIPIKSFQARLRSGAPTYLMIVIPGTDYAAQINARPNGVLEVDIAYLVGGEYTNRETIIQANLEDIRIDQGTLNKSISLTGHKQKTFVKKSITLDGAVYKNTIDGGIRYRLAAPNVYLNPGDSVTIDTDTFDANVVSYFVSARRTTMELAES